MTRLIVHGPITNDKLYSEIQLVASIGIDTTTLDPTMPENEYFIIEDPEDE